MKVAVSFTVDIDPEAWGLNYGFDPKDKAAIREDVRNYCEQGMRDQLTEVDVLVKPVAS